MNLSTVRKSTLGAIVVMLCVSMVFAPVSAELFAATITQDATQACADANQQATSDVSGGTWFAIGCLGGLIGWLIAQMESNPPATQLLGKSPEYVASYTDCYRAKTKSIKSKSAITGCLVGAGVQVVLYAILIGSSSNTTN